jgi:hypothetical protein
MSVSQEPPLPRPGSVVTTACRGFMHFQSDTPNAVYRGRRVFFCLPTCLKSFEENPKTSCLAGDPLVEDA